MIKVSIFVELISITLFYTYLAQDLAKRLVVFSSKSNDDKLAAVGNGLVVYYDYGKRKKAKIPDEVLKAIHLIQNGQ